MFVLLLPAFVFVFGFILLSVFFFVLQLSFALVRYLIKYLGPVLESMIDCEILKIWFALRSACVVRLL